MYDVVRGSAVGVKAKRRQARKTETTIELPDTGSPTLLSHTARSAVRVRKYAAAAAAAENLLNAIRKRAGGNNSAPSIVADG